MGRGWDATHWNEEEIEREEGRGCMGRKKRKERKKKDGMHAKEERRMERWAKLRRVVDELEARTLQRCVVVQSQERSDGGQRPWNKVVVYGLGHVATSEVALHQLAMALLLQETMKNPNQSEATELLCYDPAFDVADRCLLEGAGCRVMERPDGFVDEEEEPVLFYMPHCEGPVYDMVLRFRWNLHKLQNTAILGNSFRTYREMWNGEGCKPTHARRPAEVLRIAPCTAETELPDPEDLVVGAFNNTSLMTFPVLLLEQAKAELGLA